jgi:hypothetical protein
MPRNAYDPLRAPVLWFRVRSTRADGRSCREYAILGDDGAHLLDARAFTWGRRLDVVEPDGTPFLSIVRSRAFVVSGRADVHGAARAESIGRLSRNGTIRLPSGTLMGRYRDARSMGARARESLVQGLVEAALNGGDMSAPSGPDTLVLEANGAVHALLSYVALTPGATRVQPDASPDRSFVPPRLRAVWHRLQTPRGWKLTRTAPAQDDPRLELAAALFAAELSRW